MSRAWMAFYPADYVLATTHLSTVEHGAYFLLILHYWTKGGLPDEDAKLARIARLPVREWMSIRETIAEFFEPGWRHNRVERELREAEERYQRRANAGREGGLSKAAGKKPEPSNATSNANGNATSNAVAGSYQPQSHSVGEHSSPPEQEEASASSRPKRARLRTSYPEGFEQLWGAYPTDAIMSKKEAFAEWQKLADDDRAAAVQSVPAFKAYCASHADYRPVHLCRYLKQRRFESVASTQRKVEGRVFVEVDTEEWIRWKEHGLKTRGRGYPTAQRSVGGRIVAGWEFPSRWPPGHEPAATEKAA